MQRYTVYFIWKPLYMFQVVPPPIIRREYNRYCYLPLSAGGSSKRCDKYQML